MAHETDSVLRLVQLSQSEKEAYFQTYIENLKLEEEAVEKSDVTPMKSYFVPSLNKVSKKDKTFYFYNPTTVAFGKNEFVRIWGARALEANWRWSNKTVRNEEVVENELEEAEIEADKSRFTIAYYFCLLYTSDAADE